MRRDPWSRGGRGYSRGPALPHLQRGGRSAHAHEVPLEHHHHRLGYWHGAELLRHREERNLRAPAPGLLQAQRGQRTEGPRPLLLQRNRLVGAGGGRRGRRPGLLWKRGQMEDGTIPERPRDGLRRENARLVLGLVRPRLRQGLPEVRPSQRHLLGRSDPTVGDRRQQPNQAHLPRHRQQRQAPHLLL